MPFYKRLLIFAGLWILAGAIPALFSKVIIGVGGDSELSIRLNTFLYAPQLSAVGVAYVLFEHSHDGMPFLYRATVVFLLLAYAVHAIMTLTRKSQREFLMGTVMQVIYLAISSVCVLHYLQWVSTIGMDPP